MFFFFTHQDERMKSGSRVIGSFIENKKGTDLIPFLIPVRYQRLYFSGVFAPLFLS